MSDSNSRDKTAKAGIKPVVLVVIDGWGVAPASRGNAITRAKTKTWDNLLKEFPNTNLIASGEAVGLAANEVGSSGVGHLTIGAGRVVPLNVSLINRSIATGLFFDNQALNKAVETVLKNKSKLHLMGLIGTGTVHSSVKHLEALIEFCQRKNVSEVCLHLFTDGRDSSPQAGKEVLTEIEKVLAERKVGKIATISGRYYAMDRDRRWERTEMAFEAIAKGKGRMIDGADKTTAEVLQISYDTEETDEFVVPTVLQNGATIEDKDAVVFFNFRADRAIQLTKLFLKHKLKVFLVTMTNYHKDIQAGAVAFDQDEVEDTLGEVVSKSGMKQLHMAESEKERMVTYYFGGLREEPFGGEERVIVPSPNVPRYDKKPEMSLRELVEAFEKSMSNGKYDFVVMNMANPDMVSHSGNLKAAIIACEEVDHALKEMAELVLKMGGAMVITADHGNAEGLLTLQKKSYFFTSDTGVMNTDHSNNPVPVVVIAESLRNSGKVMTQGALSDVAPTILGLMNLSVPSKMKGRNLLA
jgi:2,3-bisphosphoglycerate-independent phosphoglycerate mutase